MVDSVRIDGLPEIMTATRDHVFAVMKDAATGRLTVGQVLDLLADSPPAGDSGVYTALVPGGVERDMTSRLGDSISVKDFGAEGDTVYVEGAGTITSPSLTTLVASSNTFSPSDVLKTIVVRDAGAAGVNLVTTIAAYVSETQVTLTDAADGSVSDKDFWFGTDDTDAIQAALDYAAGAVGEVMADKVDLTTIAVHVPPGQYLTSDTLYVGEGTKFYSPNPSVSVIRPTHTGVPIQMGSADREYSNIVVDGIGVIGNRSGTLSFGNWATTTSWGIYGLKGIRGCAIRNCMVTQCTINFRVDDSYQFLVERNYGIYALQNNLRGNNLTASQILWNRFDWAEVRGIFIDNSVLASAETIGLLIMGNAVQICWQDGILLYDCQMATITANFFEANYRLAAAATYAYADVRIIEGPNNGGRGLEFTVSNNFFTPGSSPNEDVYTAISCDRAKVLNVYGNACRDDRYYYFVKADDANVEVLNVWGNAVPATVASRLAFVTGVKGMMADTTAGGVGSYTFPDITAGKLRVQASSGGANVTSNDYQSSYLLDCSAGNRQLTLRDEDCEAGRVIFLQKKDGGSNQLIAARPASGSTKTINGAASINTTAAYGGMVIKSDGVQWYAMKV